MFRTWVLCVLVVASVGCKRGIEWEDQKIKSFTVGPFSAPIPAGWRDLHELVDKSKVPQLEASMLMAETAETEVGFQANIIGMWGTPERVFGAAAAKCDEVADLVIKQQKATSLGTAVESTVDGDRMCTFSSQLGNATGTYRTRFHGDQILFLQCLRATKGDPVGDAGCAAVWGALKLA
ncbi:hypothetical protein BH11MYX1_BH11MYX1_49180 [soil metagenome]